jgi:hypothetical protein
MNFCHRYTDINNLCIYGILINLPLPLIALLLNSWARYDKKDISGFKYYCPDT